MNTDRFIPHALYISIILATISLMATTALAVAGLIFALTHHAMF